MWYWQMFEQPSITWAKDLCENVINVFVSSF